MKSCMHYLKRKKVGNDGFLALKLDMSKAYNRIEYNYLEEILRKMGFSEWWIHLVLQCVTAVTYSIIHEKLEMGPIFPTRGIRQGDPCLLTNLSFVQKIYPLWFTSMRVNNGFMGSRFVVEHELFPTCYLQTTTISTIKLILQKLLRWWSCYRSTRKRQDRKSTMASHLFSLVQMLFNITDKTSVNYFRWGKLMINISF